MTKIDIIIPYVDGATPGYEELSRRHTNEFVPCQLRSLGELRYVLRSIAVHAPWAHVLLVVQSPGHVPDWVDRTQLRVVLHDDFIPKALLPTFHAATICAHMHLIPDLSERYIFWADDVVVTQTVLTETFFDADGEPVNLLETWPIIAGLERFLGTYQLNLTQSRALVHRLTGRTPACFLYPHMPLPLSRRLWTEFFDLCWQDEIFVGTVTRRSRGDENRNATIDPMVTHHNWLEATRSKRSSLRRYVRALLQGLRFVRSRFFDPGRKNRLLFGVYPAVNETRRMRKHMQALLDERPIFINVNDEAYDDWEGGSEKLNPASQRLLLDTLQRIFPEPSRFERKSA